MKSNIPKRFIIIQDIKLTGQYLGQEVDVGALLDQ